MTEPANDLITSAERTRDLSRALVDRVVRFDAKTFAALYIAEGAGRLKDAACTI